VVQFLYLGFSQQAGIRCYRFQGIVPRGLPARVSPKVEFTLNADISLLGQYSIPFQDGPALCLGLLTAALGGDGDKAAEFASYTITPEDFSAFASARAAVIQARLARRKPRSPFKPSASSQMRWHPAGR
jgi:hypothetical protein